MPHLSLALLGARPLEILSTSNSLQFVAMCASTFHASAQPLPRAPPFERATTLDATLLRHRRPRSRSPPPLRHSLDPSPAVLDRRSPGSVDPLAAGQWLRS